MRRKMKTKKTVAVGLSIAMLSTSTGTWAESVQTSELVQETQETVVEEPTLQVDGEKQEVGTEALEVSAQVETLVAETEAAQYPEKVSIYPQENLTTAAEVLPETVLESTVENILPAETLPEETVSIASEDGITQEDESSIAFEESVESTEIQTTIESLEYSTEEASEQETESEVETATEFESESETQELESFEEPETDGYLEDASVEGDFKYQVSKRKVTIVGYLGNDSTVTIPSTIAGYPVTTIGYEVFYKNQTITEVILPEGLTTIESFAFANSGLTSVVIPGSITSIGDRAFSESQLVSAEFCDGDEYTEATLGNFVFMDCEKLKSVTLSENVVSIGSCLIYGTKVGSITIPKSVKTSGWLFGNGGNQKGALSNESYLKEIIFEEGIETIPAYIAAGAQSVEKISIPEGVKTIGDAAFQDTTSLPEITLPKSLKTISEYAFANTDCLPQVIFPEGIKEIGAYSFFNSGLTSIVIPGSITSIGDGAFRESQLVSAEFCDGDEYTEATLGNFVFMDCEKLKSVTLSENVVRIGRCLIYGTKVGSITIPKSVKTSDWSFVGENREGALSNDSYLKEIIFEEGIETIPAYIAAGATNLEKAVIPYSVTEIGEHAFENCSKLVIYGFKTSYAETYANVNQIPFEALAQTFSITQVAATSYNKLKISWSAYEEADGYAVYRMNEDGSYSILKYITDRTVLSYVNTVTCGVTYTYKVAPYRMDGKKKVFLTESEPVSAKALPAAPELQNTNMAAYNKIRIIWTKVNGCEGYVIYRSEAEDGKYSVLKTVTQATATNYVNVVRNSTMYYYKIRAFVTVNGKKIYGDYSNILSGNVISGSPQNFAISQASNGKITFTWNKVEDADGYVIYLYDQDTNKYKAIKSVADLEVLTYTKKMTKGASYHFAMRAYRLINGVKIYSDYGEIVSTK